MNGVPSSPGCCRPSGCWPALQTGRPSPSPEPPAGLPSQRRMSSAPRYQTKTCDAFLFHHYSLSRNISNLISKHSCLDQATWIPWWQIIIIDCLTLTEQRKIHYCHLTYFIKQTITISAQISVLESCMCKSFSLTFRHTQQIYWFKFIWLPHFIFMHTACLGNVLSV